MTSDETVSLTERELASLVRSSYAAGLRRSDSLLPHFDGLDAVREALAARGIPGDPLQPTTISKGFPTSALAAGLPRLRFHDLRHSSASFLLHMGIPPLEVARILGHSSVTTTMTIYAHAIEEQTSPRAAQVMDDALRRTDAPDPVARGSTEHAANQGIPNRVNRLRPYVPH